MFEDERTIYKLIGWLIMTGLFFAGVGFTIGFGVAAGFVFFGIGLVAIAVILALGL